MRRILIVEDDPSIAELIELSVRPLDAEVRTVETAADALATSRAWDPDLVTLDLSLPDGDGTEVCRALREFSDAYVVMITARSDEIARLVGLEVGADDYLAKPFSPRELQARAAALLRRPRAGVTGGAQRPGAPVPEERTSVEAPARTTAVDGRLVLDRATGQASLDGTRLLLTPAETDLLAALLRRPGYGWNRFELGEAVFGGHFVESDFLLDIQVAHLRRKLGAVDPGREWVRTVGGTSYTLAP